MSEKQRSLIGTQARSTVLLCTVIVLVYGIAWIVLELVRFRQESEKARTTYVARQEQLLRHEVGQVIRDVNYQKSLAEDRLREAVKQRTYEAHRTATHIYEQNKNRLSRAEIGTLIHDALVSVSWDEGRGYYFAEDMQGVELINRNNPELEGTSLMDLQDSQGIYIMREIIATVQPPAREGFCTYHWSKPGHPGELLPKISYVKYFEPLDWVIGNGKYLNDEEQAIKDEVLPNIAHRRFGADGYFFAATWDGISLCGPGAGENMFDLTDANGVKPVQRMIEVSRRGGGFVRYVMPRFEGYRPAPKLSYAEGIADWGWYIGAGKYIDEVDAVIASRQAELLSQIRGQILIMVALLTVLWSGAYIFVRGVHAKARRNLSLFSEFFTRSVSDSLSIDLEQVHFSEFRALAASANTMVDERNRAERERKALSDRLSRAQKMEAIGLMAGGVAHDLNNILSGLVSYPDLLLQGLPPDDKMENPLRIIRESGLRAAEVVDDLLAVARGAASARAVVDLNTLVDVFMDSAEMADIQRAHASIRCVTEPGTDLFHASCSESHVHKCLMNLVLNAMQAIGSGDGEVVITTRNEYRDLPLGREQVLKPGEYAVVSVRDNGPGIAKDDLDHIFEPFYTKKKMGKSGTGLGLTVVWSTMQDHGGGVEVQSGDDGTTFDLYFPATRAALSEVPSHLRLDALRGNGERILVVDDEGPQRQIAQQLLQLLNYRVEAVPSGEAALGYLADHDVDLMVLDMIMDPGIGGRETFERAIALKPGIRTIIASGYSENDDVASMRAAGASHFVKKPYTLEQFGRAVMESLNADGPPGTPGAESSAAGR